MHNLEFVEQHKIKTELKRDCTVHTVFEANPNPRLRRIERKETWSRVKELGQGGFGIVYLEQEAQGALRAVKRVLKSEVRQDDHDSLRELFSISICSKNTANFPAFYGWFDDFSHIYIAMEYFPLGDLKQCISGLGRTISEGEARTVCYQIALALEAIHERSITHRDVKPNNVFVVEKEPNWHVKLGDFGISKHVRNQVTAMHTIFLGPFVAPEVRKLVDADEDNELIYTSAVDIWSLGSLTYWLVTQKDPFTGPSMRTYLKTGKIPEVMSGSLNISQEGLRFIKTCLELDPANRPSAHGIFEHSWLRDMQSALPAVEVTVQDSQTSSGTTTRVQNLSVVAAGEHTVTEATTPRVQSPTARKIPPVINRNLLQTPNLSARSVNQNASNARDRYSTKDSGLLETLLSLPGKLFVFDERGWTLWATGQIKILKLGWIANTGRRINRRRIYMQDETTTDIVVYHYIHATLKKSAILDYAGTWTAPCAIDEDGIGPIRLAIAFADYESFHLFWNAYNEARTANCRLYG